MEILVYSITFANTLMLLYMLYRNFKLTEAIKVTNGALYKLFLFAEFLSLVQSESDDYECRSENAADKFSVVHRDAEIDEAEE